MNESTECQALKARAIFLALEQEKQDRIASAERDALHQEAGYQHLVKVFPTLKKMPDGTFDLCGISFGLRISGWDVDGKYSYCLCSRDSCDWHIYDERSFGSYLMMLERNRVNPSCTKGFWASLFS